jgi:hypothetical protein
MLLDCFSCCVSFVAACWNVLSAFAALFVPLRVAPVCAGVCVCVRALQSAVAANAALSELVVPLWRRASEEVLSREAALQRLLSSDREVWRCCTPLPPPSVLAPNPVCSMVSVWPTAGSQMCRASRMSGHCPSLDLPCAPQGVVRPAVLHGGVHCLQQAAQRARAALVACVELAKDKEKPMVRAVADVCVSLMNYWASGVCLG